MYSAPLKLGAECDRGGSEASLVFHDLRLIRAGGGFDKILDEMIETGSTKGVYLSCLGSRRGIS